MVIKKKRMNGLEAKPFTNLAAANRQLCAAVLYAWHFYKVLRDAEIQSAKSAA